MLNLQCHVEIGRGLLPAAVDLFRARFGDREAALVADPNTFAAAGRAVLDAFQRAGHPCREPFIYGDREPHAEYGRMEELEAALGAHEAVPVAVGSGTLNDLTKLAAHRLGRPYLCVATAASVDGYTAFGASITCRGSKQTFDCPPPRVVVADLDVLCAAPPALSAAGYADLQSKVTAGADWILADALGVEPIVPRAWELAQGSLGFALADPAGVRRGEPEAVRRLTEGLMQGGFAMEAARSSRPASGAEHQFSHLWDMQHHAHRGRAPLHGFKVGIATLAVARLYERVLALPLEELEVDACCSAWPEWPEVETGLAFLFEAGPLRDKAREETAAKHPGQEALRDQLERLRGAWPELRGRLREHLLPAEELRRRLAAVGAPTEPEQIGISPERLRASHRMAYHLRRRFTVLDLALQIRVL